MHACMMTPRVEASHYDMVIVGWGEDEPDNNYHGEENKLQFVLSKIRVQSPNTTTIAYCGQFENIVPSYDAQRIVMV